MLKLLASKTQVQSYLDIGSGPQCTITDQVAQKLRVAFVQGIDTVACSLRPKSVSSVIQIDDTHSLLSRLPSKAYDLVTCYMSLHHIDRKELPGLLRNVRRVLRAGGYLFVREIDADSKECDNGGAAAICCPCKQEKREESELARLLLKKQKMKELQLQKSKKKQIQKCGEQDREQKAKAAGLDGEDEMGKTQADNEQVKGDEDAEKAEESEEIVELEDLCPAESINGNATRSFLSRERLKQILCKRL